jgi:hypothetical protein
MLGVSELECCITKPIMDEVLVPFFWLLVAWLYSQFSRVWHSKERLWRTQFSAHSSIPSLSVLILAAELRSYLRVRSNEGTRGDVPVRIKRPIV